jgi:hypothetical protein
MIMGRIGGKLLRLMHRIAYLKWDGMTEDCCKFADSKKRIWPCQYKGLDDLSWGRYVLIIVVMMFARVKNNRIIYIDISLESCPKK